MSNFLRSLILIPLLIGGLSSHALAASLPTTAEVQQQLDRLNGKNLTEAELKLAQQPLEQALSNLQELANSKQQLVELKQQIKSAPHDISELQRKLTKLNAATPEPASKRYAASSLSELQQLLNERSAELIDQQRALSDINSQLINAQTRPERAQTETSANQVRLLQIIDHHRLGEKDCHRDQNHGTVNRPAKAHRK